MDSGSKEYGTKDSEVISMAPAMIVGFCSRSSSVVNSMESTGANSSDVTESAAASMERGSGEHGVGEEAASSASARKRLGQDRRAVEDEGRRAGGAACEARLRYH